MRLFKPAESAESVEKIDLKSLLANGKRCLMVDLEGTLVPRETWEILPEKLKWIKRAEELGFKICLLSNTVRHRRSKKISEALGAPIIIASFKPLPFSFKRAMKMLGASASNSVMIGDQLFMDILGGNLLGIYTILVKPITEERNIFRKFMRYMESLIHKPLVPNP